MAQVVESVVHLKTPEKLGKRDVKRHLYLLSDKGIRIYYNRSRSTKKAPKWGVLGTNVNETFGDFKEAKALWIRLSYWHNEENETPAKIEASTKVATDNIDTSKFKWLMFMFRNQSDLLKHIAEVKSMKKAEQEVYRDFAKYLSSDMLNARK